MGKQISSDFFPFVLNNTNSYLGSRCETLASAFCSRIFVIAMKEAATQSAVIDHYRHLLFRSGSGGPPPRSTVMLRCLVFPSFIHTPSVKKCKLWCSPAWLPAARHIKSHLTADFSLNQRPASLSQRTRGRLRGHESSLSAWAANFALFVTWIFNRCHEY